MRNESELTLRFLCQMSTYLTLEIAYTAYRIPYGTYHKHIQNTAYHMPHTT